MNEHPYTPPWPMHPPSPYVTHQDLAPVHTKIGSLEKGQEHILSTYAHLRGEMLQKFDEVLIAQRAAATAAASEKSGLTLSTREVVVVALALILVGMLLARIPGIEGLIGG